VVSVDSDPRALLRDLGQLEAFLAGKDEYWSTALHDVAQRIATGPDRDAALQELKGYFGGMGSLNDILFCETNRNIPAGSTAEAANGELDRLLDRVFRELCLLGVAPPDRKEWLALEAEAELPPRVQNAFRSRKS
jgi:Domain of unknown function (DUF6966)